MSHRNQTTRTPKGKAKACQVITFDQAIHRILAEERDPAFVAEEARRDSPKGKLDTLEFSVFVTCLQIREMLFFSPEARAKASAIYQASKDVMAGVLSGRCTEPNEMKAEFDRVLAAPPQVPTVEIPKALALDLIRCLDEADFVNEATEDELEAGIHHQRFEAHKARMMALVNGIGNHLCDAGNDTGEAMLGALSATYRDQEDRRVDACV